MWTQDLLTQYLYLWLSFFPLLSVCLCRKLQESQDSMSSRLEEAEHKAQSLQTGTSLLSLYSPACCYNQLRENSNTITEYEALKPLKTAFQILSVFPLNAHSLQTFVEKNPLWSFTLNLHHLAYVGVVWSDWQWPDNTSKWLHNCHFRLERKATQIEKSLMWNNQMFLFRPRLTIIVLVVLSTNQKDISFM